MVECKGGLLLSVLLNSCFLSCEVPKAESFLNQEPYQLELHHCLDYIFKSETERVRAVSVRIASVYADNLIRLIDVSMSFSSLSPRPLSACRRV